LDALWASLQTKTPTLNGYSGNVPPRWPLEDLRTVQLSRMRRWVARHHASTDGLCVCSASRHTKPAPCIVPP
jgi:hypothetical protein